MAKFQKDRVSLLKALRALVTENIDFKDLNSVLESEVGEFITEISDKRRYRRLKILRRELDKLIESTEREERLSQQEYQASQARMEEANRVYAQRSNDHQ